MNVLSMCHMALQAALQQQAQDTKKKVPAIPRAAGGEKWWDSTLMEWPENDFRCAPGLADSRPLFIPCNAASGATLLSFLPYFDCGAELANRVQCQEHGIAQIAPNFSVCSTQHCARLEFCGVQDICGGSGQ